MLPDPKEICLLKEEDTSTIEKLDAHGFLAAPGESFADYRVRVSALIEKYRSIRQRLLEGESLDTLLNYPLGSASAIPEPVLREAQELNERLFGFRIDWVPAYFLNKGLGILWGGCTVSDSNGINFFFIRKDFKKKKKWFLYSRRELLAHELCHVARTPVGDSVFEEHFAYMTSDSAFRKYAGNCFRKESDAILFILPALLLLAVQALVVFGGFPIPVWPFWISVALWPLYLLLRNQRARKSYSAAVQSLRRGGFPNPAPVLFRLNAEEIEACALLQRKEKNDQELRRIFNEKAKQDLRWRIILRRFGVSPAVPENDSTR